MIHLLAGLMLAAAPSPCNALWPTVWKAYSAQELKKGLPPLFVKLPDAKDRLGRAWVAECRAFDKEVIECAHGVELEAQLAGLRRQLEADKVPPAEIERLLQKVRDSWSVLECREVDRALDRAGAAVARDAGLP